MAISNRGPVSNPYCICGNLPHEDPCDYGHFRSATQYGFFWNRRTLYYKLIFFKTKNDASVFAKDSPFIPVNVSSMGIHDFEPVVFDDAMQAIVDTYKITGISHTTVMNDCFVAYHGPHKVYGYCSKQKVIPKEHTTAELGFFKFPVEYELTNKTWQYGYTGHAQPEAEIPDDHSIANEFIVQFKREVAQGPPASREKEDL
eukprot:CAMPEP_0117427758 /NCGR_PEP_ID=MMETSP0758-20121206/7567_1 /TAXON_ID=63605 /ORGANISM="Percolomonas cosmopolitus, Strain AE-1 (ATCC 50343)" /LENGTH=200 /DNA_ID=CAMNT_0005213637 /DNA_START=94 /DNA_END=696 /DNA_ORIENTATION=-